MEGWIKLHRKIMDSWVYQDPEALKIWLHILLNASHSSYKLKSGSTFIQLFPGQVVFGKRRWGKELNINPSKVYRVIQMLAQDGMITVFPSKKHSILTVCNWFVYQSKNEPLFDPKYEPQNEPSIPLEPQGVDERQEPQNEPQMNHERTEDKNVKNERSNIPQTAKAVWDYYIKVFGDVIPGKRTLTKERRNKIIARLNDGYTEIQLCKAISNFRKSKWHIENGYYDITTCFSNQTKAENWINANVQQDVTQHVDTNQAGSSRSSRVGIVDTTQWDI